MRKLVHLDDDLRLELRMVLVDLMEALRSQLHCLTLLMWSYRVQRLRHHQAVHVVD